MVIIATICTLAVFMHSDGRVKVAGGKFMDKGSNIDMTRLESRMSFLQMEVSMTMREKLRQVRSALFLN